MSDVRKKGALSRIIVVYPITILAVASSQISPHDIETQSYVRFRRIANRDSAYWGISKEKFVEPKRILIFASDWESQSDGLGCPRSEKG